MPLPTRPQRYCDPTSLVFIVYTSHSHHLSTVFAFTRAATTIGLCVSSGRRLHRQMFQCLVNCPIRFFDTNSSGRILNRFSKDTGWMDDMVPITFFEFSQLFCLAAGNTIVSAVILPWVIIPLVPLLAIFVWIR